MSISNRIQAGLAAGALVVAGALVAVDFDWDQGLRAPASSAPLYSSRISGPSEAFAVIGDTQQTLEVGQFLGHENNDFERGYFVEDIARRRPAFLAIVGDLVGIGSSERHWRYFDQLMEPLREARIAVIAAIGNHDHLLFAGPALRKFSTRFAQFEDSHWYVQRFGRVALVILDTNSDSGEQRQWFSQTLRALDSDESVGSVLVLGHHPAYSNSTVTGDTRSVQEDFVPAIMASKKVRAYVSGHSHAYERFEIGQKTWVVTGGGGGPRQKLRLGSKAVHRDLFEGRELRPFHYLWVEPSSDGERLDVQVIGIEKGENSPHLIDRFSM